MATKRFEKRFALKEATVTFLFLMEGFNPRIFCVEVYGDSVVVLRAQVTTTEDKLQFIKTAKTMVTKGVEISSYYQRTIRRHCIDLKWRLV